MPNRNSQRHNQLIVGITGRIGAGKTSVGKYLELRCGFYYIRYSQVLSDWKAKDHESKSRLQAVGWEVMAGGMQMELNRRLVAHIQSHSQCAVDGLRHPLDQECLSKISSDFYLLYVDSPEEIRWKRLQNRHPSIETFLLADSQPVEQYIESLRSHAYKVLQNDSSIEALYEKVDAV